MGLKRVLYAVSYWEMGYKGLKEILHLKEAGLEEILLLHVIPREEVSYVPFGGFLKEKALELKEAARLKFKDWKNLIVDRGLKCRIFIEIGDPLVKILEKVEEEEVSLLVIGKQKIEKFFISEFILDLLKRSPVPVLVYCHSVKKLDTEKVISLAHSQIFKRPLLGTDFSENAFRASAFLILLKPLLEKVFLLHVIKSSKLSSLSKEEIEHLEKERLQKLEKEASIFKENGIPFEILLRIADEPGEEILETAKIKEATLIVLGKTGKGLLEKLFLGSVTTYLLKEAELPLLVVP